MLDNNTIPSGTGGKAADPTFASLLVEVSFKRAFANAKDSSLLLSFLRTVIPDSPVVIPDSPVVIPDLFGDLKKQQCQ